MYLFNLEHNVHISLETDAAIVSFTGVHPLDVVGDENGLDKKCENDGAIELVYTRKPLYLCYHRQ